MKIGSQLVIGAMDQQVMRMTGALKIIRMHLREGTLMMVTQALRRTFKIHNMYHWLGLIFDDR